MKHKKTAPKKYLRFPQKKGYFKGALGAGTAYAILGMLVIAFGAAAMLGDIVPQNKNPIDNQPVIIISNTQSPPRDNLQLYTFPGVTYTPTPSPTPVPTNPPQPQTGGGSGGGNQQPQTGGGGGIGAM
ncbi:MAG: hypothetical protein AAB553_05805 [Patescibacteria group bacterium]